MSEHSNDRERGVAAGFVANLQALGRAEFSLEGLLDATRLSPTAARAQLRRLPNVVQLRARSKLLPRGRSPTSRRRRPAGQMVDRRPLRRLRSLLYRPALRRGPARLVASGDPGDAGRDRELSQADPHRPATYPVHFEGQCREDAGHDAARCPRAGQSLHPGSDLP